MTPSKIFFYFCISFIVGIFVNSVITILQMFLWAFLFLGVFLIFVSFLLKSQKKIQIVGFCLLFFVLGIIRHQISEFSILNNELSKLNDKKEVIFIGTVIDEPDVRDTFQKLKVKIEKPAGIVLVTASRYPEYKYLDKVKITGKLQTPTETEDFSYKNYLLKDGIYSVMGFPVVELINRNNTNDYSIRQKIYSGILFLKQNLRESIRKNFLPPHSLIMEGTILGDSGVLGHDLKDKLNITGLRHVIAVSGTHIVILSAILMSLFLSLGLWRGQAFYFSVLFICFYIVLTGMSASGVRAGIMGVLYLFAQKLGRQSMGPRPVVMAGALMLFFNPLLLLYDIGFQLSFLAVLGLVYFEPIIKNFLHKALLIILKKNRKSLENTDNNGKLSNFLSIISTTFAAQIFTLPVMVYNFGNISFISPVTNILVLPVVSWIMIFGFLSSILGAVSQFLGWIFFLPCWFLLSYFVKVIDIFSQPWAIKTIENIHWLWLLASYFLIGFAIRVLNKTFLI